MATRYESQLASAQRQLESECDCCDHGPRNAAPDSGDLYFDGWTPGGKKQRLMTLAEWKAECARRAEVSA